jgi:hypothetical protein
MIALALVLGMVVVPFSLGLAAVMIQRYRQRPKE